jgi:hypothetical protein
MTGLSGRTAVEIGSNGFSCNGFPQKRPTLAAQLGKILRDLSLSRIE